MKQATYRFAVKTDASAMADLMNSHYPRKKKESYFWWQLSPNHFNTSFVLSFVDVEVAGMLGVQRRRMQDGRIALQLIDMIVAQKYRGFGIFPNMIEFYISNSQCADFMYVIPNLNGMRATSKIGWKLVGKIDEMIIHRGNLRQTTDADHSNVNQPYITPVFSPVMEKWRFHNHPEHNYFYKIIDDNNYAILKIFNDHRTNISYGDIVYARSIYRIGDLYRLCIDLLFDIGVEQISTWTFPNSMRYKIALSLGFLPESRERYLCARALKPSMDDIYKFCNWDLDQSDAEMY